MPWHRGGAFGLPRNAHTGAEYHGQNIVTLWCMGLEYPEPVWASYRQWAELGCQVRKGEKGSPIIYYSTLDREDEDGKEKAVPFIKHSAVFNSAQVDGYEAPERPEMPPLERLEAVDEFVRRTGANVVEGGSQACYIPALDIIKMPEGRRFIDSATSTRTESYYSTLLHELTHASGHRSRLNRDMTGRFGSEAYAAEELVAELGAAFLCAKLSITPEPRADHSQYINSWLKALKNEKKFIFSASTQAQLAADYLLQLPV